jgi:hypothetical protein
MKKILIFSLLLKSVTILATQTISTQTPLKRADLLKLVGQSVESFLN